MSQDTINKFLTEEMDECWHDFFTWEGFGKLLSYVREQEWLPEFLNLMDAGSHVVDGYGEILFDLQSDFIDPETFAKAVYTFLTEEGG